MANLRLRIDRLARLLPTHRMKQPSPEELGRLRATARARMAELVARWDRDVAWNTQAEAQMTVDQFKACANREEEVAHRDLAIAEKELASIGRGDGWMLLDCRVKRCRTKLRGLQVMRGNRLGQREVP